MNWILAMLHAVAQIAVLIESGEPNGIDDRLDEVGQTVTCRDDDLVGFDTFGGPYVVIRADDALCR